ncbi:MAG: hypothetical protein RQM92_17085 [Candidatus Syntrophopropionicum ammoniitolerans]
MFFKRTKSKLRKTVFIIITVLIAIGLVIPLAALFQKQPTDGGAQAPGQPSKPCRRDLPIWKPKRQEALKIQQC